MDHETTNALTVLDEEELLARCMGNLAFAETVLRMFHERCGVDLGELEQAIDSEDVELVARLAHRMKGASANAAAPGIQARAAEIEQAARRSSLAEVPHYLTNLKEEFGRFTTAMTEFRLSPQSAAFASSQ
jgi:HPt (histidine-containing phosphotransfer) domain-containing protein